MEKKTMGWKEKVLSKGGTLVMIKAVSQSLLVYAMSYLRFPKEFV